MARIGPAQVRERYGVDPAQVPDFIALRGDPSDKIPGARGVGETGAANLIQKYGSLEAILKDGRFPTQADELRLFREIATMNAKAPIPKIPDQKPTWSKAAALMRKWELSGVAAARRLAKAIDHRDEGAHARLPIFDRVFAELVRIRGRPSAPRRHALRVLAAHRARARGPRADSDCLGLLLRRLARGLLALVRARLFRLSACSLLDAPANSTQWRSPGAGS
jgi:hypothetical protein